ncbi:hypothetical protein [Microbacterium aerolatum]
MDTVDGFEVQPTCPECGTVLRDAARGYVCVTCNAAYRMPQRNDEAL